LPSISARTPPVHSSTHKAHRTSSQVINR
jgi:hypothetical protein